MPGAMRSSSAWTAGGPARMSPDRTSSAPAQSVTVPPASRIRTAPAATSHGPEGQLEEPVEHAGRHPRQVEGGGAGPAEVLESLERRVQRSVVAREHVLVPEREARPHDGLIGGALGHVERLDGPVRLVRPWRPDPRRPRRSRGGTGPRRPPRWAAPVPRARPRPRRPGSRGGSSWCRPAGRPASSGRTWRRRAPRRRAGRRGWPRSGIRRSRVRSRRRRRSRSRRRSSPRPRASVRPPRSSRHPRGPPGWRSTAARPARSHADATKPRGPA